MAVALKRNGIECYKILEFNGVSKEDAFEFQGHAENSPSPTVYYTFETGSGTTVVDRSVGTTTHTGTFASEAPDWDTDDPKTGTYSMLFEENVGADNRFTVAHHADLDWAKDDSFSISAWVKAEDSGYCALWTKRGGSTAYQGFFLGVQAGRLDFYLTHDWAEPGGDEGLYVRGTSGGGFNTLSDGSWHHLVVTYSGTATAAGVRSWVDGNEDTTQTAATDRDAVAGSTQNGLDITVGADSATSDLSFGDVDELVVWDGTVLTPAQVAVLYNSGGTPPNIPRGL